MAVNKNSQDNSRNLNQGSDRNVQGRKDGNLQSSVRDSEQYGGGSATGAARDRGQQDFESRAAQEPNRIKGQGQGIGIDRMEKNTKKDQR